MPSRVEPLDGTPPSGFDCGRDEQNTHLHQNALHDQQQLLSRTYLINESGLAAAYVTVCMDALPLGRRERGPLIRYQSISSLKLAQLAVDRRFQGLGLGTEAVATVVRLAQRVGEQVGCRYVTLDAQPELVTWYAAQGFTINNLRQDQRIAEAIQHGRNPAQIAVSMRFDIRDYKT
jgi:GNAT superfamily N-acetyltransferase